jgi:hypothetical protein
MSVILGQDIALDADGSRLAQAGHAHAREARAEIDRGDGRRVMRIAARSMVVMMLVVMMMAVTVAVIMRVGVQAPRGARVERLVVRRGR